MSMFTKLPSQFYDATAFDAFSVDRDFYLGTAKAMAWLSQLAYETDQSKKIEGILSTWKLRLVDVVASEEVLTVSAAICFATQRQQRLLGHARDDIGGVA